MKLYKKHKHELENIKDDIMDGLNKAEIKKKYNISTEELSAIKEMIVTLSLY